LRSLSIEGFDQAPGERVALSLRLFQPLQLLVDLQKALALPGLGIRRRQGGVGLSLLPPGGLPRLALDGARVIGNGVTDGGLDG